MALLSAVGLPASAQIVAEDYKLLGAAVRVRPAYDGSASERADLVPIVRYFGKPWFARTTQGILEGGARWRLTPGLDAGVQLAYEEGRKTKESDFLEARNFADIDPSASIGAHLEWDAKLGPAPISLLGRMRQNLDTDRGWQADLRLNAGVYGSARATLVVFGQLTWGSDKAVNSFYGVPPFEAKSGLMHASIGLIGGYDLTPRWTLLASYSSRHLQGDAADSPLAEKSRNDYATAGIAYRF